MIKLKILHLFYMKLFVPFAVFDYLKEPPEIENWSWCADEFEYEYISDNLIEDLLNDPSTLEIDLNKQWKDNSKQAHAQRIASIIIKIKQGIEFESIQIELSTYNRNRNKINDGNHRIRAYQFLKKEGFFAELGGTVKDIIQFESLCRNFSNKK